jgi:DNA-binding LacI/PurR family transcriptional regulator
MAGLTVKTKSDQVREILLADLRSGKYDVGSRMASDNVLARDLGISKNTVREAVSSLVSEGYCERIQGKGTFVVSTSPNSVATDLKVVHLICRDTYSHGGADPFINDILCGVHNALANQNATVCLDLFAGDSPYELLSSDQFRDQAKQGVILAGFTVKADDIAPLLRDQVPVVSIGKANNVDLLPYVDMDHTTAVRNAVGHLLECGHRNIAYLDQKLHAPSYQERFNGYVLAHQEAGVPINDDLIFAMEEPGMTGVQGMREIQGRGSEFSALLAYGNDMLIGAIRHLQRQGLEIPEDVSVVAYSSYTQLVSECFGFDLTRIEDDMQGLGKAAIDLFDDLADGRSPATARTVLQPRFIVGNTVGPCSR